jgi:hypothetical protein
MQKGYGNHPMRQAEVFRWLPQAQGNVAPVRGDEHGALFRETGP